MTVDELEALVRDVATTLSHSVRHPGPRVSTRVAWPEMTKDWLSYNETVSVRPHAAVDIDIMDRVLLIFANSRVNAVDKKIIWHRCLGRSWRRTGRIVGLSHEYCRRRYLPAMSLILNEFQYLLTENRQIT